MSADMIFGVVGGLGLFFFGMKTMSEGLKKIAGQRLKNILYAFTKHRVYGVAAGALVTVLIQSSSATTVMVVGFVNAGLLGLKQAIGVIMGANIGTTFTAWLVSSMSVFKITSYALPAIGIGFAITALTKTKKNQSWGQVLLGFGLLFIGLSFLKDSFGPLKDSPALIDAFVYLSHHPIAGIFAGIVFTVLLQSSSATIAIVQVLAFNGVISFEAAIPIILGDNIGTTITAQMAAIGTNLNARRAAMSHTLFNVIGVAYMTIFVQMGWFGSFIDIIIPGEMTLTNIMFYIAVSHSTFNVLNTIVFLPFVGILEKACIRLVPQKDDDPVIGPQYLEKHLLDTPSLALEQIHKENAYMLSVAEKAVLKGIECLNNPDLKLIEKVSDLETATDDLQSEITQYIVDLSQRNLLLEESEELPVLIHNVNDIERIGDHSQNLSEIAKRKMEEKLPFSEQALLEIQTMSNEVRFMLEETRQALERNDVTLAGKVLEREGRLDQLQEDYKRTHIARLNEKKCNMKAGFLFLEFIDNLEKIGDRLTNVAQSVIGKMKWELHKKENEKSS